MVTQIIQMQQDIEAYLDVFLYHGWTGDYISYFYLVYFFAFNFIWE